MNRSSGSRIDSESSEVDSNQSSDIGAKGISRERFRVGVCLLRIYGESDPRARCYVSVDPHRRVRWLEKRLRKLLALTDPFVLRSRGHLLPSAERLTILCPDDPLEVFPITTYVTTKIKHGKESDVISKAPTQSSFDETDKGKSKSEAGLELYSLYPTKNQCEENNESVQETENETDLETYKEKVLAVLDSNFPQSSQCDEKDNIWIMDDYSNVNNQCIKRKRVRRRRRKNISSESPSNGWENTTSSNGRAPRIVHALPNEITT